MEFETAINRIYIGDGRGNFPLIQIICEFTGSWSAYLALMRKREFPDNYLNAWKYFQESVLVGDIPALAVAKFHELWTPRMFTYNIQPDMKFERGLLNWIDLSWRIDSWYFDTGNVSIIQWMNSKHRFRSIASFFRRRTDEVIKKLSGKNCHNFIRNVPKLNAYFLPTTSGIGYLGLKTYPELFDDFRYLKELGICMRYGFSTNLEILKWMEPWSVSQENFRIAVGSIGKYSEGAPGGSKTTTELLDWISAHYMLPEDLRLPEFAENLDSNMWLANKLGILPNHLTANLAAARGDIPTLDWCKSFGVLPSSRGLSVAVARNQIDVLNWALPKLPSKNRRASRRAFFRASDETRKWLKSQPGFRP